MTFKQLNWWQAVETAVTLSAFTMHSANNTNQVSNTPHAHEGTTVWKGLTDATEEKGQFTSAWAWFSRVEQYWNKIRVELKMLSHISPHNRLRGEEETAFFSDFFSWNSTLALKKGAEITLACASKSSSADRGRRIIFGRHLSLSLCAFLFLIVSRAPPQRPVCVWSVYRKCLCESRRQVQSKSFLWLEQKHL